jgi:hypothetical protein
LELLPQHFTAPETIAQLEFGPDEIAVAPDVMPVARTGTFEAVPLAFPSWPRLLLPEQ